MTRNLARWLSGVVALLLILVAACAPESPPNRSGLQAVTAVPTLDETDPAALCASVRSNWGRDWPTAIRSLEALEALGADCSDGSGLLNRLYTAYLAYGTLLEQHGRREEAIHAYQNAMEYNFAGTEVMRRLQFLGVYTPEPPVRCDPQVVSEALSDMPEYAPTVGEFVQIDQQNFTQSAQPYRVYGINYYPRDYPERRFLNEMEVESIVFELDLLRASGLNTLRIYIRHEDLFMCPGNGAIPIPANLARLDAFIQAAAERGFKLILVLNDDADLTIHPLYNAPEHTMQQMAFIASRYRDEPAVMAYDLRGSGDRDYLSREFAREDVLEWLVMAAATVRRAAPRQLVTAGWGDDAAATAPLVDFVSFQHFGPVDRLRQTIAVLQDETQKPLLLAVVGYNTYDMDELGQRQAFQRAFEAVDRNGLAGWVVWIAFDYPLSILCVEPNCPAEDGPAHRYGIWTTSYFPKRALDAVELATGVRSTDESDD